MVAALSEDGHAGRTYEVTGPRLLTWREAVGEIGREIGRVSGRDVRFAAVPPADYAAALDAAGLEPEVTELLIYLFTEVSDGRNASLTGGVQAALGRPPRDFAAYAADVAATGAWDPARV
jgi:uncharacterized protein YbjT (DUF2867 family)